MTSPAPRFLPPRLCRDLHPICGSFCWKTPKKSTGSGLFPHTYHTFQAVLFSLGKPQKKGNRKSFQSSVPWLHPYPWLLRHRFPPISPRHSRAGDGLQRAQCRVCWFWISKFFGFLGGSSKHHIPSGNLT